MDIASILNSLEAENDLEQLQKLLEIDDFKIKIEANHKILNILHFNVCSAFRHFDEILIFLQACNLQDIDILILGETRNNFSPDQFNIPGFSTFFNNSTLNQNDGLLIFINNKINFEIKHTKVPSSHVTLTEIMFQIYNMLQITLHFRATFCN